jgi:hypothetical protein
MLAMIDDQLTHTTRKRTIIIQTITEQDKYEAAKKFGIPDAVAQAMAKGLCYIAIKGAK